MAVTDWGHLHVIPGRGDESSHLAGPIHRSWRLPATGPPTVAALEALLTAAVFTADRSPARAALAVTLVIALVAASRLSLVRQRHHDRAAQQAQDDARHQPPSRPRPGHEVAGKTIES